MNTRIKVTDSYYTFHKYGMSRRTAQDIITKLWVIPGQCKDITENYFLLYWTSEYFFSQYRDGTVTKDGKTYNVIYFNTSYFDCKEAKNLKLSFRAAKDDLNIGAYVLVTPVYESAYEE